MAALKNSDTKDEKLGSFLRGVRQAFKQTSGGLLPEIAKNLLPPGTAGAAELVSELTPILQDLSAIGKLRLPDDAVTRDHFKPEFASQATNLLTSILSGAGLPSSALATRDAISLLKKHIDACGAIDVTEDKRVKGPDLTKSKSRPDREVILYYVDLKDDKSTPNLPKVKGEDGLEDEFNALTALDEGFSKWSLKLKLDISAVGEQDKANLLVTSEPLGVSTSMLATTEIGPPRGRQLRMTFNSSKTFSSKDFEANASHELGHALGIFHEDVDQSDTSLVMHGTNLGVSRPQQADLLAAKSKGGFELS